MPGASAKEPGTVKGFAQLLDELPAEADTVTLVGVVTRCSRDGHFRFTPQGGGRPVELPVEAVRSHCVLHREQGHLLVQLEADRAKVDGVREDAFHPYHPYGGRWSYVARTNSWEVDLLQKAVVDPQVPPFAEGGLAPFVLATPHHAPAAPLAMQGGWFHPQGVEKSLLDGPPPPKHVLDPIPKYGVFDPIPKHGHADNPLSVTVVYGSGQQQGSSVGYRG